MTQLRGGVPPLVHSRRTTDSFARVAVAFIVLLAFAVQSYVVQTHIHLAPDAFTTTGTSSVAKSPAAGPQRQQPDKFPARDDPANCPICQEILHSGQFVTPQVAAALLPTLSVSIVAIVVHVAVVPETTSHAWQSRGPPQH